MSAAAKVWFAPVRTTSKRSLVTRAGELLVSAGLGEVIADKEALS